jgi:lysophospholipase L1-like esterase
MSYMKDADGIRLDTIQVEGRLDDAEAALLTKADLVGGKVPDSQIPVAVARTTDVTILVDETVDEAVADRMTIAEGDARYATLSVADLIAGQFPQPDRTRIGGPLATDATTVNLNVAGNPIYNQQHVITANALPAGWPVDVGDAPILFASNFITYNPIQPRLYRVMTDANRMVWRMVSSSGGQYGWGDFYLWIDGRPVSLSVYDPPAGASFTELIWADAKPRLVEILTCAPLQAVYCPKPYRMWMPPEQPGIKALLVGDSYSAGNTATGGTVGAPVYGDNVQGFGSRLGMEIGVGRWSIDAVGGTGFIQTNGGANNYNDRRAEHITRAPDVLVVGGCGANDLLAGYSAAAIITAATTYFTAVRAALPNTKLICLEGFTPPVGFGTFNDEYVSIRMGLQEALEDVGVYYIDIATSAAWLDGSGYVGATSGVGNSDIYVGNDGVHLSPAGNTYVLKRLAPKIRAAIADNGALLNTLI